MRSLFTGRAGAALTVGVVAVITAGGGYALAAGSSKVINACANRATGALRVSTNCTSKETTLQWNEVGAAGSAGSTGTGPKLIVYNAAASSATSAPTKIGTVGLWTIYGQCHLLDSGTLVQTYLYFSGPAFTENVWGVDDNTYFNPYTLAAPATTSAHRGQLGESYSGQSGVGSSGYSYTWASTSGRFLQNVVVLSKSQNQGAATNSCHATDAVTPLG